jgi:hypothetical protein
VRIGGEDGETVRRRDKAPAPDDEIAVAIAIGRGADIGRVRRHHQRVEIGGVDQIGVGVVAAEILQRGAMAHRAGGKAQPVFENFDRIRAIDRMHRIERHGEAALARGADRGEIEQAVHQVGISGNGIDDIDRHAADHDAAQSIEIDIGRVDILPAIDGERACVDRAGHAFGRRAAVGDIIFDPEIFVGPPRIMAGGQDQPTDRAALPDHVAGSGGREDAACADDGAVKTGGGGHADRGLDDGAVMVAPVAADHQRCAAFPFDHIEHRLDEIFGIIGLGEDPHFLAQARCAGFLIGERRGGVGAQHQSVPARER